MRSARAKPTFESKEQTVIGNFLQVNDKKPDQKMPSGNEILVNLKRFEESTSQKYQLNGYQVKLSQDWNEGTFASPSSPSTPLRIREFRCG